MNAAPSAPPDWSTRWQRFSAASVRTFHVYANWLVGISWRRFILLGVLLMIISGILQNIPPFSWEWTRTVVHKPPRLPVVEAPAPPAPPAPPAAPASAPKVVKLPGVHIEKGAGNGKDGVEITIDERGVRIVPKAKAASAPASGASSGNGLTGSTPSGSTPSGSASAPAGGAPVVDIRLPAGETSAAVRAAVTEARAAIGEAIREAREEAAAARAEAELANAEADAAKAQADAAKAEAQRAIAEASRESARAAREAARAERDSVEIHQVSMGEFLPSLAMLWIIASAIIKVTYKKQIQAEAQAAQAVETAEAESLRRQVLEARMAAMQAQVEPHFLFNTLASIDHLIEVDPRRASQMQKNLIALLRASMPTMREADGGAPRDLGRELAVIRPYLEILKVRMEERLSTAIDVPEGLQSAEFPAMMVQTLVENAIKHGLEPKPEGGHLLVKAEIVHGKLQVTVADTGLGFGRAATAGTGVGLANIRERLQLLYGAKASLTIAENPGGGTRVTVSVPYKPVQDGGAA